MPEFYIAPEASIRYELRAPGVSEPQPFPANPALRLPLGSANGLNDISGNGRNGTAAGGLTVGGYADAPGPTDGDTATDFDGIDDRITTTYATRRNYILNPSFEVDANNYGQAGSSRTNLIPNPSMETGITGWSAIVGSSVWSTDAFMFGTNAFKSVSTGAYNRVYTGPAGDATAGTTYTASGYGRTEESGRTGKVMIRFFDSGGNTLQSTDGTTSSYTASTWQRFSVTATAPPGTAKVGMALYWDAGNTASSGQVCYADGFLIETGSSLLTYFPNGTQLADPNIGITWAGTAHASASTWTMKVTRTSAQSVTGSYSGYVTTNGQGSNGISGFSSGAALPAGRTWTASCYVKADTAAIGQTLRFTVAEVNAGSAVGISYTDLVLTGAWQRVSVTRTFTTGTDFWAYATLSGNPAAFWVDGYMFEEGSSVGSVFPEATQLASGEAGWTGTPHASYSDIGCFANGTSRTFMGWFNRDALGSSDVLFGGSSDAPGGVIRLTSANFLIVTDGTNTASFSPEVTTVGEWMHIAVVVDEPNNLASCYINGQFYDDAAMSFQYPAVGSLVLGATANGSNPFDGKMAEVCVYERALTATEIQAAVAAETPARAVAVLNDPSDPDFCGYLDGEEAISGIDSPEIRDSYSDLIEQDGGVGATNFYSRRPIVMNGIVLPISPADRNAKIGKLMAATDARSGDGTLTWTPSGGETVFAKYRRQLPFRATGGFNKKFQIGLACNDPRIYTQRAITMYTETNGNSGSRDYRRFTWSSGTGTTLATRNVYLPPGTWDIYLPVKRSTAAGTLTLAASSSTGADTPGTLTTDWTEVVQTRVTSNAESVATTITLTLDAALTTGQWVEVGDLRVESPDGLYPSDSATFATNWTAGSGYTASFQTASPPPAYIQNPGNALSRPRVRLLGPFASASATIAGTAPAQFAWMIPGSAYSGTDYAVIDFGYRTVVKNGTTNDYGAISTASTWGGFRPDMADYPYLSAVSGATTATRMETTWRGVWL
jgi:hypothetical protein